MGFHLQGHCPVVPTPMRRHQSGHGLTNIWTKLTCTQALITSGFAFKHACMTCLIMLVAILVASAVAVLLWTFYS